MLLFDYHLVREPGGDGGTDACDAVSTHQYLAQAFLAALGTPVSDPAGYASRSVVNAPSDFAHIPTLLMWGLDDCTVPFAQACEIQAALTTAGVSLVNYHLDASGAATTVPVAGCAGFGPLATGPWPGITGFTGDRYAIALDAQGHGFTGIGVQRLLEAVLGFLASHV